MRIAVIGAGASGLACAVAVSKSNPEVVVDIYEKNSRVGKKILATGNGRCNLTNLNAAREGYRNIKFASYALEEFSPESNIEFFNSLGLFTRTDSEGRVYPLSNQASSVLDALYLYLSDQKNVNILTDVSVDTILKRNNTFIINSKYKADKVVISCGGKAAPSQGSDGSGYLLLKSLSHSVTDVYPGLVQMTVSQTSFVKALKGVRCQVNMALVNGRELIAEKQGELLFTDYGLSGIVSMEISSHLPHCGGNAVVLTDFVPSMERTCLISNMKKVIRDNPSIKCENLLSGFMPKKLGQLILKENSVSPLTPAVKLTNKELSALVSLVKCFGFTINGTKDFESAQVTLGGADTDGFDRKTLESKRVPGLYCAGEILDVDGDCGGYNLNWAWSSGRLVARSIIE